MKALKSGRGIRQNKEKKHEENSETYLLSSFGRVAVRGDRINAVEQIESNDSALTKEISFLNAETLASVTAGVMESVAPEKSVSFSLERAHNFFGTGAQWRG